jgi:hypothetical protein
MREDGLIESVELLALEIRKRVLAAFKLPALLGYTEPLKGKG